MGGAKRYPSSFPERPCIFRHIACPIGPSRQPRSSRSQAPAPPSPRTLCGPSTWMPATSAGMTAKVSPSRRRDLDIGLPARGQKERACGRGSRSLVAVAGGANNVTINESPSLHALRPGPRLFHHHAAQAQPTLRVGVPYFTYGGRRPPMPPPRFRGSGKRGYACASASCGAVAGALPAGCAGSSAASTACSTRSSQTNSISLRAISGMSS